MLKPRMSTLSTRARRIAWVVVAAMVVVATALVVGSPGPSGPALNPRSASPDGTKALALLLNALGAHVELGPTVPSASDGVALVLQDHLNDADRSRLNAWVNRGGRLVITDPFSNVAGVTPDQSTRDRIFGGRIPLAGGPECAIPALSSVGGVNLEGNILLHAVPDQTGCYPAGSGFALVVRDQGEGTVVVIGGPAMWENANLGHADNSVLAASLLAPTPGTNVTFVGESRFGGGNKSLLSLISPRIKEAFWGLLAAFVLLVLWKARRLGKPVVEELPVELAGSGLVAATGNLFQESRQRSHAASILRTDLKQLMVDRMGIDPRLSDESAAQVVSSRTGIPLERMEAAFLGPPPRSDDELVALAVSLGEIREEVVNVR